MKIVLCISRGKCRVELWRGIIIIIRKTASTFHNGLTANNENTVLNFANNGDFTPRYPSVLDLGYPPKQIDNFYTHQLM